MLVQITESSEYCCTCARSLSALPRCDDQVHTEKPHPEARRLDCCMRIICGNCINENPRYRSYCPYCQISTVPSTLPQGLKEPPSYYSAVLPSTQQGLAPPPYNTSAACAQAVDPLNEKAGRASSPPAEDTLHFLNHAQDTIMSLSLRYRVPAGALRRANSITSDYLLLGRKTVIIPGAFYKGGVSLSPRPIEGEEEELRKGKIRRFMVGCKVVDYDMAVLYLEQADYDLEQAAVNYVADEEWEARHPHVGKRKQGAVYPCGLPPGWRNLVGGGRGT